jgi:enamine deaminase RidA (YjgF/YER057c/UK114 family)
MTKIDQRLEKLGLELPEPVAPLYSYIPLTIHNGVAYVSGQVPRINGEIPYPGKVGKEVTVEQARELAQYCVLKALSSIKAEIGNLDKIDQILKLSGYIQAAPGFTDMGKVMDAASELLVDIFGEKGKHARVAIGAAELPSNTPVELDLIIAVNENK